MQLISCQNRLELELIKHITPQANGEALFKRSFPHNHRTEKRVLGDGRALEKGHNVCSDN